MQLFQLRLAFHAFGDYRQVQRVGHVDDVADQIALDPVRQDIVDERLVDLERADRQTPQVGERGVAGAEVVQRDLDAQFF